jgi:hypothetical protein
LYQAQQTPTAANPGRRLVLAAVCALTLPEALGHTEPALSLANLSAAHQLLYRVRSNHFPYLLNGELLWQRQGARYTARLSYSLLGKSRYQISSGLVGSTGLQPEQFTDHIQRDLVVRLDHQAKQASFEERAAPVALLSGAQDRLSVLLQLGLTAAGMTDSLRSGAQVSMQTLGHASADVWTWRFDRAETLALPQGNIEAQKWLRQPLQSPGQQLEVWLAPSQFFLPVRIRITEPDGDYVDQQWLAPSKGPVS